MGTKRTRCLWPVPLAAALLLWPALWNGYPIVFADTGTYLSQAIHRYLGWDRPAFYSVFMLFLHATITTWPVVMAQALIAAWVLRRTVAMIWPGLDGRWLPVLVLPLAAGTWLPFLVSELTPDVFTPLLVLAVGMVSAESSFPHPASSSGWASGVPFEYRESKAAALSSCSGLTRAPPQVLSLTAVVPDSRLVREGVLGSSPTGFTDRGNEFGLSCSISSWPGLSGPPIAAWCGRGWPGQAGP